MEEIGYGAHVFRAGPATAADPLRPGVLPALSQFGEFLCLTIAVPAVMHRIPLLAGVGIDNDGFGGDPRKFADQAIDQFGSGAIDAYPDDLRLLIQQFSAGPQCLSVRNVGAIATGEAEIYRQIGTRA